MGILNDAKTLFKVVSVVKSIKEDGMNLKTVAGWSKVIMYGMVLLGLAMSYMDERTAIIVTIAISTLIKGLEQIAPHTKTTVDDELTKVASDAAAKSGILKLLLIGVLLMGAAGAVRAADDGIFVSGDSDSVTIQNVYWSGCDGAINATIPWKNAKVAYFVDLLHSSLHNSSVQTAAGAEGPLLKVPYTGPITKRARVASANLLLAAIVSGGKNRGLCGLSIDVVSANTEDNAITETWGAGPWIGSAFDGEGPYGGVKAYTRF